MGYIDVCIQHKLLDGCAGRGGTSFGVYHGYGINPGAEAIDIRGRSSV